MVATIVGWYGTETKGDVAILDGIINVLEAKGIHDVLLGSLFPFYTERTLYENELLFLETAPNVSLSVFSV